MTFREKLKHKVAKEKGFEEEYLFGASKEEMATKSNEKLRERNLELKQEIAELKKKIEQGIFIEKSALEDLTDKKQDYVFNRNAGGQRYRIKIENHGESIYTSLNLGIKDNES